MELVPVATAGRQVIERYSAAGFRITGLVYPEPVLVFPDRTQAWVPAVASGERLEAESLAPVAAHGGVEILLLGLGRRMTPLPAALRAWLKAAGIAAEPMDTGAACRTYNVLLAEDRRVAAALLLPV